MTRDQFYRLVRADKPTGFLLVLFPALAGLLFASYGLPSLYWIAILTAGAFCVRSIGCIINDRVDRELDKQVARTQNRPLASGEIAWRDARLVLLGLVILALGLWCLLPWRAMVAAAIAVPLIIAYPNAKRVMAYPQYVLGITFNMGVFVGWFCMTDERLLTPIILYVGCVAWTIGYDTIYAIQDKAEDIKAGVQSTAITWGAETPDRVHSCYMIFLGALLISGFYAHMGWIYNFGLFGVWLHLHWQLKQLRALYLVTAPDTVPTEKPMRGRVTVSYDMLFRSNTTLGFLVVTLALLGHAW